ncbi:biopolymer transporter ExbD [candidate division WOR-3 bacterium]|nr:biopolymer transporter ExbD [candidate division WOR-3 bacterium]
MRYSEQKLKLARRSESRANVPTASMSDIAFLLLLFFMVTTVFMAAKTLPLTVPEAESTQRIKLRKYTISAWIDREGTILVDDYLIDPEKQMAKEERLRRFGEAVLERYADDPEHSVVLLRGDMNASYGLVSDLMESLRNVDARRITFATQFEEEQQQ